MKKLLLLLLLPILSWGGTVQAAGMTTGWYLISPSSNSTLRLNITKETVSLKKSNNSSGQKFYVQKLADGTYKIATGSTGGSHAIGSNFSHKAFNKTNDQKWIITANGDNYTIKNKSTGKFLSFSGTTLNVNTTASLWKFQPYSDKYTVTFKNDARNALKRQSVVKNGTATAPSSPTKTGYTFAGWDKTFNKITSNLTVNAQWNPKKVKITFHRNLNSSDNYTWCETYTYDVANQSFGMNIPEENKQVGDFGTWKKDKYRLSGWSLDKNAINIDWSKYANVSQGFINKYAGDLDVYAVWDWNFGHHVSTAKNGTKVYWYKSNKAPQLVKNVNNNDATAKEITTNIAQNARIAINGGTWYMSGDFDKYPRGLFAIGDKIYHSCQNASNEEVLVLTKDGKLLSENLGDANKTVTVNGAKQKYRKVAITAYDSSKYKWAVKGNYVIMENGEKVDWFYNNQHTESNNMDIKRQPESFICQDTDGYYYLATTGGRGNEGVGVTYDEIYEFATTQMSKKIDFIYVLDGGGSATYVQNGKLLNKPTSINDDGSTRIVERPLPNSLVIY